MREIDAGLITAKVKELCMDANFDLPDDVLEAFKRAKKTEESPLGVSILEQLLKNADIARKERVPICQDTGFGLVFVEMGEDVRISGGSLKEAITEGVRQGYQEGYLRKSICHPFTRKNTGDNTPPIIHIDIVPGQSFKLTVAPKGGGSENMSRVTMLKPSDGIPGIKEFVVNRVKESGGNPCPPIIVGVGIGGTFEYSAFLAKKALLRPVGTPSTDPELAEIERDIFERINNLGIGPMGLGGRTTALGVHVEMFPCHIASLPLAVNINCHATRHKDIVL
ncbi:MAG: fumarate hydratase [Thermodesulfobacteriota bacterium]|nr:fumarate hydratase [Thermodesulfobacteriota bacterium]